MYGSFPCMVVCLCVLHIYISVYIHTGLDTGGTRLRLQRCGSFRKLPGSFKTLEASGSFPQASESFLEASGSFLEATGSTGPLVCSRRNNHRSQQESCYAESTDSRIAQQAQCAEKTPLKRARTSCAHAYYPLQVTTYQRVFGAAHELVELHCALICKLLPINPYNPHSNAHKMAATDRQAGRQTQARTACRKQDCQRKPRMRFVGQFIILPSGVSIHLVQKRTLSTRTVVPIGSHASLPLYRVCFHGHIKSKSKLACPRAQ